MSTFFKSAAMTLLSKTLQTLLYKYLSDVDVEGVNLPSLYNSDGHSGWGVRLSNVKLREGAKLMDLPGQHRKKRKRRQRPPRGNRNRGGRKVGSARRRKGKRGAGAGAGDAEGPSDDGRGRQVPGQQRQRRHAPPEDPPERLPAGMGGNDGTEAAAERGGGEEEDATQSTSATAATTVTAASSAPPAGSSAAAAAPVTTTTTSSSRGWFSWYRSQPRPAAQQQVQLNSKMSRSDPPPTLREETGEDDDEEEDEEDGSEAVDKFDESSRCGSSARRNEKPPNENSPEEGEGGCDDVGEEEGDSEDDYEDYEDDDDDDEEEEEEEEDQQHPMLLRLGKGGRIGILDVRLVGKEIHVYVEDAFLSVEAVRVAPPPTEPSAGADGKEAAAASSASGTAAAEGDDANQQGSGGGTKTSPEKKASFRSTSSAAKKKAEAPEPKTVGERVMAENALARALSALPNLFVRDVRVRFVILDEAVQQPSASSPTKEPASSVDAGTKYGPDDSIIDFSIELLSITDGADFLANYRGNPEDELELSDEAEKPPTEAKGGAAGAGINDAYYDDPNEYLVKRIRTGRGPDGGLTVCIYPPRRSLGRTSYPSPWARRSWDSTTQSCVLRCSGLDLQGRIFLGAKNDTASSDGWMDSDYDDEYNVDYMLFGGVDYIAPGDMSQGPPPPLPPILSNPQPLADVEKFWVHEGATVFRTDTNGILSSTVNSSFHRVARGLTPAMCDGDHLPCEYCSQCWEALPGVSPLHPLDAATPMGGLVLSIVTRDPLEINVDRASLEVLGDTMSLLKKKPETETSPQDGDESIGPEILSDDGTDEIGQSGQGSTRFFPRMSSRNLMAEESIAEEEAPADSTLKAPTRSSPRRARSDLERDDLKTSFPDYMQPEKVQVIGLLISDLVFRVHVMEEGYAWDEGLSFCFWDVQAKCLTLDYQALESNEKSYQDLRFDVGHFVTREHRGPGNKQIMSIGLRKCVVDFDEMTIETLKTLEEMSDRPPWPTTAAALLDVQPPLETLMYEERDRHALQVRYISVSDPSDFDHQRKRSHANIRIGPASVDVAYEFKDQVPTIISEARATVFGPAEDSEAERVDDSDSKANDFEPKIDSVMKYKLHLDGGRVRLEPRIEMKLPLTIITGDRSSEFGLFFETLLERVSFSYGERDPTLRILERGLSLQQLAALPESVRLRLLLFLPDLKPLERALCIRTEKDSFLRCRSVNKGIVKVAKRAARGGRKSKSKSAAAAKSSTNPNRRQELMSALLALDDDTLEDLVMAHKRYTRKSSQHT